MKDISRRRFIKYLGAGAIGLIAKPKIPFAAKINGSRASDVIQCFDENATSGSTINESVVQIMMDESIKTLTGITDVGEAWKSVFPGITANSIIGIKVNCLFQIPTHLEFTMSVVNSLTQMDFSGTNYIRNNIIIWDNQDNLLVQNGGYTIYDGNDPDTVRCFGTNHGGVGYDYTCPLNVNGVTSYPSRILTTLCDYIVNAAVIKDHSISQITLTMKNNYGSVNNPGSLHGTQCNPYIPSLNQQIRDVITPNNIQKIFITDALFGCYSGGPGGSPNFNPKMTLMSLDPVACDYHGQYLINQERIAHGLPIYDAPHITTAAQPPYNLGTTDINLIEINNPSNIEESKTIIPINGVFKVSPNPFRTRTTITLSLERNSAVHLDLINTTGRITGKVYSGQLNKGTHRINYNLNKKFSAGHYFIRLYNQGQTQVKKVMILH
ncbi:hypothetical protein ES707_07031 [subsurface metagenome]